MPLLTVFFLDSSFIFLTDKLLQMSYSKEEFLDSLFGHDPPKIKEELKWKYRVKDPNLEPISKKLGSIGYKLKGQFIRSDLCYLLPFLGDNKTLRIRRDKTTDHKYPMEDNYPILRYEVIDQNTGKRIVTTKKIVSLESTAYIEKLVTSLDCEKIFLPRTRYVYAKPLETKDSNGKLLMYVDAFNLPYTPEKISGHVYVRPSIEINRGEIDFGTEVSDILESLGISREDIDPRTYSQIALGIDDTDVKVERPSLEGAAEAVLSKPGTSDKNHDPEELEKIIRDASFNSINCIFSVTDIQKILKEHNITGNLELFELLKYLPEAGWEYKQYEGYYLPE